MSNLEYRVGQDIQAILKMEAQDFTFTLLWVINHLLVGKLNYPPHIIADQRLPGEKIDANNLPMTGKMK